MCYCLDFATREELFAKRACRGGGGCRSRYVFLCGGDVLTHLVEDGVGCEGKKEERARDRKRKERVHRELQEMLICI